MSALTHALDAEILVLDGGLGTLLEARGNDLSGSLWSARLLRDDPAEVRAAHEEFVAAGADVIITSSYQLGFGGALPDADVIALLRRSVDVAREAGARFVAASVGPFGALRADGSEYSGRYGLTVDELRAWHHDRLVILAESGADALAAETIPSLAEAEALCAELYELAIPAWLSLSGSSTGLGADEVTAAFARAHEAGLVAAGVNCCAPDAVLPALAQLPAGLRGVAYPNSGEVWNAGTRTWQGDSGTAEWPTRAWRDAGARLIGGCCRTTPADITAIRSAAIDRPVR